MSFGKPDMPALPVLPTAPAQPPAFGSSPIPKRKGAQSMQPSFLGTQAQPGQGQLGSKTLLGQ